MEDHSPAEAPRPGGRRSRGLDGPARTGTGPGHACRAPVQSLILRLPGYLPGLTWIPREVHRQEYSVAWQTQCWLCGWCPGPSSTGLCSPWSMRRPRGPAQLPSSPLRAHKATPGHSDLDCPASGETLANVLKKSRFLASLENCDSPAAQVPGSADVGLSPWPGPSSFHHPRASSFTALYNLTYTTIPIS